jgi:hypothetical protein
MTDTTKDGENTRRKVSEDTAQSECNGGLSEYYRKIFDEQKNQSFWWRYFHTKRRTKLNAIATDKCQINITEYIGR